MKPRGWVIIGTFIVIIGLIVGLVWKPWEPTTEASTGKDPGSTTVGVDGGTFKIHDFTVTVPKGAVDNDTTLTMTTPQALKSDEGPFPKLRKAGQGFDITLSRGDQRDIQPKEPLEVTFPLAKRPAEAANSIPLVYTPGKTPGSYMWLPTRIEGNTVRVGVWHLSPKYLVYAEGKSLLDTFSPEKAEINRDECPQEATIADQKIKIKPTGWSLEDSSPMFGCLLAGLNGTVGVGVTNRFDYALIVPTSSNIKEVKVSPGSFEDELGIRIATYLPGNDRVKAYIPRGSKLTGHAGMETLPTTVDVSSDVRTFMGESAVRILNLAIGLITGEGSKDKVLQTLDGLLKGGGVVDCLQKSLGSLTGEQTVKSVADATGNCFIPLFTALADQLDFGKVWQRIGWLLEAVKGIVDTAISAYNGIRLELNRTMKIQVSAELPACPKGAALTKVMQSGATAYAPGLKVREVTDIRCKSPWMSGVVTADSGDPATAVGYLSILHYENDAWKQVASGQDMGENVLCRKSSTPDFVRDWMNCRI